MQRLLLAILMLTSFASNALPFETDSLSGVYAVKRDTGEVVKLFKVYYYQNSWNIEDSRKKTEGDRWEWSTINCGESACSFGIAKKETIENILKPDFIAENNTTCLISNKLAFCHAINLENPDDTGFTVIPLANGKAVIALRVEKLPESEASDFPKLDDINNPLVVLPALPGSVRDTGIRCRSSLQPIRLC